MVILSRSADLVFHALADTTRRRILEKLAQRDRPVMEIVKLFDISQPAITKHLNVLETAGLILRRRAGRQRVCRLKPQALTTSLDWIERCRRYWNARLDALEEFLAESQTKEKSNDEPH